MSTQSSTASNVVSSLTFPSFLFSFLYVFNFFILPLCFLYYMYMFNVQFCFITHPCNGVIYFTSSSFILWLLYVYYMHMLIIDYMFIFMFIILSTRIFIMFIMSLEIMSVTFLSFPNICVLLLISICSL